MQSAIAESSRLPNLDTYMKRSSALELARRSLLGAPVYTVISLIMLAGTPMLIDYGAWAVAAAVLLILLGGVRVWFALDFEQRYDRIGERVVIQFSILTALQSLALGLLSAMVIWQYWATQQANLTIVLSAGCIAAGTSVLSVRRSAQLIFLACVLAPFGIAVYLVAGLAQATLIIVFLSLMAFLAQDGGQAKRAYFKRLKEHYGEEISRRRTALELQAKQEFINDIGHDISAPVNSIIGMTSLLMEEKLNTKTREIVEAIQSSGNSLLSLIANVPGAIKTVHDAPEAQLGVLDLKLYINKIMDLYAIVAGEKGLKISVQIEDIPENLTSCNHNHIEQVLANLMSNALKNTDRGSVSLSASCEILGDGAVMIEFSLADTGIGIPVENRQDIFIPHSCEADNGVADSGGAGSGLPMCKGLVELMGGDIWIEDNVGQGTVVKFTIREELDPSCHVLEDPEVVDFRLEDVEFEDVVELEDVNSGQKPGKTRQKQGKPDNLKQIHPLKILVVDDDDIHRKILSFQLQKLGYAADEAADGEQAVAAVMQEDYDLIFMDIRMPKMNGIESTHWILERFNGNGNVRIIALTGDASNEAREQCMQAGMDNFVIKPVRVNDLEAILRHGSPRQKQQMNHTQTGTVH